MRCKTKQREDSRSDPPRIISGLILGYRRTTSAVAAVYDRRKWSMGGFVAQLRDGIEINDHRVRFGGRTEFGLSPSNYEGRFRKRRRPSLYQPLGRLRPRLPAAVSAVSNISFKRWRSSRSCCSGASPNNLAMAAPRTPAGG